MATNKSDHPLGTHARMDESDSTNHFPKGFLNASDGTMIYRDETGNITYFIAPILPIALDLVNNTSAPPTENDGDIYVLDNTGTSHVDWDGAPANSWVRYNVTNDVWTAISPTSGQICMCKTTLKYYNSAWLNV